MLEDHYRRVHCIHQQNESKAKRNCPKNSEQWWNINRILMNNTNKPKKPIPPLKSGGAWLRGRKAKADCLAATFHSKCMLPDRVGDPDVHEAAVVMNDFIPIRKRDVVRILKSLDSSKATGSDALPARVLKECAVEVAPAVLRLVRQMVLEGMWPEAWRQHLVEPLHKKGSKSDPAKYRGVHMTSILSKVCERVLAKILSRHFESTDAFGDTQWAFRAKRSRQDMIAIVISKWLLELNTGKKIGLYLTDISGAFDRVSTELMLQKAARTGLSPSWLKFLKSYLAPRQVVFVVEGVNPTHSSSKTRCSKEPFSDLCCGTCFSLTLQCL